MLLGLWLSLNMAFAETTSDIEVLVKGMVCSFCVQGVEKKFGSEDAVEKVEVKLDESKVLLWIKDDQNLVNVQKKAVHGLAGARPRVTKPRVDVGVVL